MNQRPTDEDIAFQALTFAKQCREGGCNSPLCPATLGSLLSLQSELLSILASQGKGMLGDHRGVGVLQYMEDPRDGHVYGANQVNRDAATNTMLTAMEMELCEIRDRLQWKPWRQTTLMTSEELKHQRLGVALEIADLLHFVLNLAVIWGLDEFDLAALYARKNAENRARATEGY